jgi:hypothetical protein
MIDVDVSLGANEIDASDSLGAIMATCGVETNDSGEEFVELPGVTCGFIALACCSFSSVFFVRISRKHLKLVQIPGLTTKESSDSEKHTCFFNRLTSMSSILRLRIAHGSFVKRKHGTELISCNFNSDD